MRLAVVFPGIGYHADKPLLYYSKKLAASMGCEIVEVPYKGFGGKKKMIGNEKLMKEAFELAARQTEEILSGVPFKKADTIVFLSKSVGTAVAAWYASAHHLDVHHVYYTPVEGTFHVMEVESGIAFHGTSDPWVATEVVKHGCAERKIPLYITENANHSLETGIVPLDLANLQQIMRRTEEYLASLMDDCWRVTGILEDDYGCEELPEGAEVCSLLRLERTVRDGERMEKTVRLPDRILVEQNVEPDMLVRIGEDGLLSHV